MIADQEANVLYFGDVLERRFPTVHGGLKMVLIEHGIPLRTILETRDVWCRESLPIHSSEDRFGQFRFAPTT